MHIMVEANIIISAVLFPNSVVGNIFSHIAKNHTLVLCQYTLDELKSVFKKSA
jgi:predicted nucleic acid-binding protein